MNSLKPRFKVCFSREHLQLLRQASGEHFKMHFLVSFFGGGENRGRYGQCEAGALHTCPGLVLEILREDSSFFCSKPSEDRGRQISVDIIFPSFLAFWNPRFMQELAFSLWLGPKNYLLFPELCSLLKPDFGSPEIGRYPLGQILLQNLCGFKIS